MIDKSIDINFQDKHAQQNSFVEGEIKEEDCTKISSFFFPIEM
jgi:hypothetical protein